MGERIRDAKSLPNARSEAETTSPYIFSPRNRLVRYLRTGEILDSKAFALSNPFPRSCLVAIPLLKRNGEGAIGRAPNGKPRPRKVR